MYESIVYIILHDFILHDFKRTKKSILHLAAHSGLVFTL